MRTDGSVQVIKKIGNTVYLGGSFTEVGYGEENGASINVSTGMPDLAYLNPNNTVYAAVADGSGGWYIGGAFTRVGSAVRNRVAHINADGSLDSWNPNANNTVYSLTISGANIYVGGLFTTISGITRNSLAAVELASGLPTSWNPNLNGGVWSILPSGNNVYVGGEFTTASGVARNYLAAIDQNTGIPTSWNPNASAAVRCMTQLGTNIYVGGNFTTIGGQTRNRIGSVNTATGAVTSWNPNASNTVNAMAVSGNTLYIGGAFIAVGGSIRNRLAALDATSGVLTSWSPNANTSSVNTMAIVGNTVYVGGGFTTISGLNRKRLAAIDATTAAVEAWDPGLNGAPQVMAFSGNNVYVGGAFELVNSQTRNYAAALDAATGVVTSWNPNLNSTVNAIAAADTGNVYLGGTFYSVGGQSRNYLASVNNTTGAVTSWNPNPNYYVYGLAVSGNTVYVGGVFNAVGNVSRNRLAAVHATTGALLNWNPNANSDVTTLYLNGTTLYVGGYFTSLGGVTRNRIAALDIATNTLMPWNPNSGGGVLAIDIQGNTLYAAGDFGTMGGSARSRLAGVDVTTGFVTPLSVTLNSSVRAVASIGNHVYIGGSFTSVNGTARSYLASVDATTGTLDTWNPTADSYINTLMASDNKIHVGGSYGSLNNDYSRQYYMPLQDSATIAPSNTIAVGPYVTPGNFCQGGSLSASYTVTGTFNAGNVFSVELSDANGSFANPTIVGTLADVVDGTISATIPGTMPTGTGYRFRITSSSPAFTSADNGADITLYAYPTAAEAQLNVSGTISVCSGNNVALSVPATAGFLYRWRLNGTNIPGATNNTYNATQSGTYSALVINPNSCYRTSDTVNINIGLCVPVITSIAPTALCQDGTVAINFTATGINAGNTFTAQLSNASGSFASTVTLGTLVSSTGGTINAAIPTAQATGTGYRIRIISSNPATTGPDNGTNLSVVGRPSAAQAGITPAGNPSVCQGSTVSLAAPYVSSLTYQWTLGGANIASATSNIYDAGAAGVYNVIVTNANGCSRTSSNKTVSVTALPTANITAPTADTAVCPATNVVLSAATASGNTYQWLRNGAAITGATTANYTATDTGAYSVAVTKNACSVTSAARTVSYTVCSSAPVIASLSPSGAFCQGSSVSVDFTAMGMAAGNIYTVQLSNASGSFASPVTIGTLTSSAASGTISAAIPSAQAAGTGYRIRILSSAPAFTGADNGTNLAVIALPTSGQVSISPTTAQTICTGGSITYSVPATAGASFQWRVGGSPIAGATANTYIASTAGSYSVAVTNAGGCTRNSGTRVLTVNAAPIAEIVSPTTTQTICGGQTVTLTAATAPSQFYQWSQNNTPLSGATNSTYVASASGAYTVTVTKGSCSVTSAPLNVINSCGPVFTNTADITKCAGDTISIAFTAVNSIDPVVYKLVLSDANGNFNGSQYIETAELSSTAGGVIEGVIPVDAPAGNGYKLEIRNHINTIYSGPSPFTLTILPNTITPVAICAVTVDSATGKNKIVFNKPQATDIDSFVFYRRPNAGTVYERIGAQPYGAFSTFTDASSDPMARAHRYYMTAKNICRESTIGDAHRTMHLTINKGKDNSTWNLIWNGYEGVPHEDYNIYRGTTPTNMALLTTIEANSYNSFTDYSAPTGAIYYKVSIADGPSCNPSLKTTGDNVWITSNIASNEGNALSHNWIAMDVWPNPSSGMATLIIESDNTDQSFEAKVIDITGRTVETINGLQVRRAAQFGNNLTPGVYNIEVISGNNQKLIKKWIKN